MVTSRIWNDSCHLFPLVKFTLFAGEKGHVCVVPDHSLLTQALLSSYKQMFTRFRKREFTHTLVTDSWRRAFNLENMQLPPHPTFAKKDGLQYKQIHGREFEGRARFKRKCLHNKHNSYNNIRIFSPSVSQAKGLRKAVIWKAHMDVCPSCALLSAKGYRRKTAWKNLVAKVYDALATITSIYSIANTMEWKIKLKSPRFHLYQSFPYFIA